jgi:trans-aconitate methyltransferase
MGAREFDRKSHWESVYSSKSAQETSWYQLEPRISLDWIEKTGVDKGQAIIDVGGGASVLVDFLLNQGYSDLTVMDISAAALKQARQRLDQKASAVDWIEADVTEFVPRKSFDVWHDRAVFHFLTEKKDRTRYLHALNEALKPGGWVIMAAFAPDGPEKCSGLQIVRYDAAKLGKELGGKYRLERQEKEMHVTPAGHHQSFGFYCFRKMA